MIKKKYLRIDNLSVVVNRLKKTDIIQLYNIIKENFDADDQECAKTNLKQYFNFKHHLDTLEKNKFKNWISIEYYVLKIKIKNRYKIIGFFGLYFHTWSSNKAFWLDWLMLSKEYREKGIGLACIKFAMEMAKTKGANVLSLETSPRYEIAIKIYEKLGFKCSVVINDYFADGDTLFIYSKDLNENLFLEAMI